MTQALGHELNLVLALKRIHKHLISFSSESYKAAGWTHLDRQYFIRVIDLSHWTALIAIPKENWRSLPTSHKFTFIIFSLRHAKQCTVLSRMAIYPFLLFKVVG